MFAELIRFFQNFVEYSLFSFSSGKLDSEDLPDESLKFVAPFLSLFLPEVLSELEKPRPFSDAQVQEVMYPAVVVVEDAVVMADKWLYQ